MSKPSSIVELACTALPGNNARPYCKACTCEVGYLARYIKANGQVSIRWVCDWCEGYTTAGDLPTSVLPQGTTLENLPLRIDKRADEGPLCQVCDSREVEYHHWAPTALFPAWAHVGGVPLCTAHHREWHDTLRAHGLRYPHELEAA